MRLSKGKLRIKASEIQKELTFQVDKIYTKQKGGYWPITLCDSILINYLKELVTLLNEKKPQQAIKHLLYEARNKADNKIKVVFFAQESATWHRLNRFMRRVVRMIVL